MSAINGVNLNIDMNFVLYKNVYILAKSKSLYADLDLSLTYALSNYMKLYPFKKINVASDSKYSWRKKIYPEYKEQRKEAREKMDINWEFVFNTYNEFKQRINNPRINLLEKDGVEGDDWIRYCIEESNRKGLSTLTISSDRDLNQFLKYSLNPTYMNFQWVDKYTGGCLYLPEHYKLFMNEIQKDGGDIFNQNENSTFIHLIKNLKDKYKEMEVNKEELLMCKIIQGDTSDNIKSVLKTTQGIGDAGALSIYKKYKEIYPENIDFLSDKWIDQMVEFIAENKKVKVEEYRDTIIKNLNLNRKLICLNEKYMPTDLVNEIKKIKL